MEKIIWHHPHPLPQTYTMESNTCTCFFSGSIDLYLKWDFPYTKETPCGMHKVDIGSINCGRIPEAYLGAGLDLFLTHQTLLDPRGTEGAGGNVSARSKQGVPLQVGADHALLQWLLVIPQDDCVRGSAIWTVKTKKKWLHQELIFTD